MLFVGFMLWSQMFLLRDMYTGALVTYAFSINCSLDALIFWPFMIYRVICKLMKEFRNDQHGLHENNILNIALLQSVIGNLQQCGMAFFVGFLVPWLPFIVQEFEHGAPMMPKGFDLLYDPIKEPLYQDDITNPHALWATVLGYGTERLRGMLVPLLLHLIWLFFINLLVILSSRTNKQIGSHKKHLLQMLLITHINFLFGNPKVQSWRGLLILITLL